MRSFWCSLVLIAVTAVSVYPAEPEAAAYDDAVKAFTDKFFERAEQQFAAFLAKYPASTNRAKAVLHQAQARHFLKKADLAVQLLDQNLAQAGSLADEYLFWKGEALMEKGDYAGAAAVYGKLLVDLAQSSRGLQASVSEALAFFRQKDFAKTVELLNEPQGEFQKRAGGAFTNTIAFQGQLLLGEALLSLTRLDEARTAAQKLPSLLDAPALEWEKFHLLARIELAGPRPELALPAITNAVAIAQLTNMPVRHAQALNVEADVYRKLNQTAQAVSSYEKITRAESLPLEQRRLALLKAVELLGGQNQFTNAIQRVEAYLAQNPQDASGDLLRLKAGELWLAQFQLVASAEKSTPRADATNMLAQARTHFNHVITQLTNSAHHGKAYLNLGWSFWEEGNAFDLPARIQESQAAFQNAIERLTRSDDQAMARFKLGDALFYLRQFSAATTNYLYVTENYSDLPQARVALFDKAYLQLVRASLELNDLAQAEKHLAQLKSAFPNSARTEEALFLYGQSLAAKGRTAQARSVFEEFLKNHGQSPLAAEVRFASARTFLSEGNLAAAITAHEQWLAVHTNHTLRPNVEFQRALNYHQAGNRTNAFNLFTNFVAQFPTHSLAPAAQNWVADFYYDDERWNLAEQNYQRIFQNTNWLSSPLAHHSRMMAARTAFFRQGYSDARAYLTNMINDPNCPAELLPEAWFVLGDVIIEQRITGSTNALNNYEEAANVYDLITRRYPTNRITPPAWGKKGDCHFQLASQYPQSYSEATNAYRTVLDMPVELPVTVINQAELGMGRVLEKLAETRPAAEREALQKQALTYYLNVVYGTNLGGKRSDPLYIKTAGSYAGRLTETLGDRAAAIELYRRLITELPAARTVWEARIQALQQTAAARPAGN